MSKRFQDAAWRVAVAALMVLSLVFLVAPLVVTTLLSFDSRTFFGPLPPPSLSLQWYERFFSDPIFLQGLQTSLLLALIVTTVATTAGVAIGVALSRLHFPGRELILSFLLSPLVVPPVVLGFGMLLYLSSIGVVDGFLRLLCGHLILAIPYVVRASVTSLAGVNPIYADAAMSLGATSRAAFWTVTLPLARSGIAAGAVFSFAVSMDDVAVSMFLTDSRTYTLPVALVSAMRASFDLTIAAAAVVFMAIIAVIMVMLDRITGITNVFRSTNQR